MRDKPGTVLKEDRGLPPVDVSIPMPKTKPPKEPGALNENQERNFLLAMRQGLLIQLGAIEDLLDVPRTRTPKRKR